ncbi:MAG: DUF2341 domain-containing protein, partial [bacterium]
PYWTPPATWTPGWNPAGQTATYWVQVPNVPTTTARYIFLYFGNPGALTAAAADPWQFFGVSQAYVGSMYYIMEKLPNSQFVNPIPGEVNTGFSGDDTNWADIPLAGFNFPFFSTNTFTAFRATQFNVCTDGYINVGTPFIGNSCVFFTTTAVLANGRIVAPAMSDWLLNTANDFIMRFSNLNTCPGSYSHAMGCIAYRWQSHAWACGITVPENFSVIMFRNGVIQFDYGQFGLCYQNGGPPEVGVWMESGISAGAGTFPAVPPPQTPIVTPYCGAVPPANCPTSDASYSNQPSIVYFARPFRNPEPTLTKAAIEQFGGGYPTSNPTIDNTPAGGVHPAFTALYSFDAVIGAGCTVPACEVRFQISPTGATWYWYNGGTNRWVSTVAGYAETNSAATVNANIGRFMSDIGIAVGAGFYWRAYLHSDGTIQTALDNVQVGYSFSRPDGRIMDNTGNPAFIGTGIYNVDASQTVQNTVANETKVTYTARVVNSGLAADTYTATGAPSPNAAEWTVAYFDAPTGGNDITAAVTAGTYPTPALPVNSFFDVFVEVTPHFPATGGLFLPLRVLYASTNDTNINLADLTQFGVTHDSVLANTAPTVLRGVSEEVDTNPAFPLPVDSSQSQNVLNTVKATYYAMVSNGGNINDVFKLRGNTAPANPLGWTVNFYPYVGGTCTVNATFSSFVKGAGQNVTINKLGNTVVCIEATADRSVNGGDTLTVNLTATNTTDPSKTSTIATTTTVIVSYQSDLSIETTPNNLGLDMPNVPFGNGVYDQTGVTETVAAASDGSMVTLFFRADNDGNTFDQLKITGDGATPGWTVNYWDAQAGGNNVTASISQAGLVIGLNKFETKTFRVEITPSATVAGGDTKTVGINIISQSDGTKKDKVIGNVQMSNRYRPDALISLTPNPVGFIGNDAYDASQVVSAQAATGATKSYFLEFQNNGNASDTIKVTGTAAAPGWTVQYFDALAGGANITAAVTGAGYLTAALPAFTGATNLRVEVTPTGNHPPNDLLQVFVTGTSTSDAAKSDTVRADTEVGFIPDLIISTTYPGCDSGAPPQCGDGVTDPTGTSTYQIKTQNTQANVSVQYYITVRNIGLEDDIIVAGTGGSGDGWGIRYFDAFAAGTDITSFVSSGGWHTGSLATNASRQMRIVITPDGTVPVGATKPTFLTARSSQGGADTDTVRTRTDTTSVGGTTRGLDLLIEGNGANVQGITGSGLGGNATQNVVEGGIVTYQTTVKNTGSASDTFTLSWSTPPGFTVVLNDGTDHPSPFTTASIGAGASVNYSLKVTTSLTSGGSTQASILNGFSTSDGTKVDSIRGDIAVQDRQFSMDGAMDGNGQGFTGTIGSGLGGSAFHNVPPSPSVFTVNVRNTGNVPDSYQLFWAAPGGFTVVLNDGVADRASGYITASINPGASLSYTFIVTVPNNASRQGILLDILSVVPSSGSFDSLQAVVDTTPGAGATQLTVSKGAASPISISALPGQQGVRLLQIRMAADSLGNDVRLGSLQLHASGNGNDATSIASVKLWDDANGDGVPDGANFLAIGSYSGNNGTVLLTPGAQQVVTKGTARNFVVTVDLSNTIATAPVSPADRRAPWAFGFLAMLGLAAVGFCRRAALPFLLLILAFGLLFTGCNGGGTGPVVVNVTYTYSAGIGPGDVQAVDAATQNSAAVFFNPAAGFQSAPISVTVQVTP